MRGHSRFQLLLKIFCACGMAAKHTGTTESVVQLDNQGSDGPQLFEWGDKPAQPGGPATGRGYACRPAGWLLACAPTQLCASAAGGLAAATRALPL